MIKYTSNIEPIGEERAVFSGFNMLYLTDKEGHKETLELQIGKWVDKTEVLKEIRKEH